MLTNVFLRELFPDKEIYSITFGYAIPKLSIKLTIKVSLVRLPSLTVLLGVSFQSIRFKQLKTLVYKDSSRFKRHIIDLHTLFHIFNFLLLCFCLVKQFCCTVCISPDPAIYSLNKLFHVPQAPLHLSLFYLLICEYLKDLHIYKFHRGNVG